MEQYSYQKHTHEKKKYFKKNQILASY